MATQTTYYGLKKPDQSDASAIGDINDNMDAIDTALNSASTTAGNAVLKVEQTLTDSEKGQARTNIGAADAAKTVSIETQSFSAADQRSARANIGALGEDDAVLVEAQTLSGTQKAQIRTNLGLTDAAIATVVNDLTTTAAGGVLDARQGRILGTLWKRIDYSYTYSLTAGNTINISRDNLQVPEETEGYSRFAFMRIDTGSAHAAITRYNATGDSIMVSLKNTSSSDLSNVTINITLLWIRSVTKG